MEQELLEKIINHALKLLARRQQSEEKIRNKLTRYLYRKKIEHQEVYIDETVAFLNRKKLLNDMLYADSFTRNRQLLKPRSKKMLRMELQQKGIDPETIEKTLEAYDEEAAIKALVEKKKHHSSQKLFHYLLRQGFPYDLVKEAVGK